MRLAEALILPLSVGDYGEMLEQMYQVANQGQFLSDLTHNNISLGEMGGVG